FAFPPPCAGGKPVVIPDSGKALIGPTMAATAARLKTPAATSFFICLRPVGPNLTPERCRRVRQLSPESNGVRPKYDTKEMAAVGRHFQFDMRAAYMPAPPSTVTARRFCDQQEMSSQTATGRSLP